MEKDVGVAGAKFTSSPWLGSVALGAFALEADSNVDLDPALCFAAGLGFVFGLVEPVESVVMVVEALLSSLFALERVDERRLRRFGSGSIPRTGPSSGVRRFGGIFCY